MRARSTHLLSTRVRRLEVLVGELRQAAARAAAARAIPAAPRRTSWWIVPFALVGAAGWVILAVRVLG